MTSTLSINHWQYLHGVPKASAQFKQQLQDFRVTEQLGYQPCGDGEHIYLRVTKQGLNTAYVAEQLAKYAQLPLRAVTYAGRKDKYAITEQTFGIHLPGKKTIDWNSLVLPGLTITDARRHNKKLKTGNLKGNRFDIVLRNVELDDALVARLKTINQYGVPNYFGEQRFGVSKEGGIGGNLALAQRMLDGEIIRNRNKRSMAISALRSWLFNQFVSARIADKKWQHIMPGDALQLSGSNSFFIAQDSNAELDTRLAERDIHITAPLWGSGELATGHEARLWETGVARQHQAICDCLSELGLKQERRAITLYPDAMNWQSTADQLHLQFNLPAGAFATSVLRELVEVVYPLTTGDHHHENPAQQ